MIKIETVSEKNWPHLVQLFSTSEECTDCWCMNHRSNPATCPTGEKAKEALKEELLAGKAHGLLAYVDGTVAGWCAVDPVNTQVGHDYFTNEKIASKAWMIHCLYIEEKFRGSGLSKALIQAAEALAKNNGSSELLAFPIPEESKGKFPKDIAEFSGRLSTFKKFGFEPKEKLNDFYQVVGKTLS